MPNLTPDFGSQQTVMIDNIGKLIEGPAQRDAVHVATAPVTAFTDLTPGEDIGFVVANNQKFVGACDSPIGIVDPFLRLSGVTKVQKGQDFLMFLYPNTITSLAHNWEHPAFVMMEPAKPMFDVDYVVSREWLEKFGEDNGNMDFEETIVAAEQWIKHNDYKSEGGRFEGSFVPETFWGHFENVTGQKVREDDRQSFFSCSC